MSDPEPETLRAGLDPGLPLRPHPLLMAVVIGLELLARRMRMPPAAAFILRRLAAWPTGSARASMSVAGERGHRSAGEGAGFDP
jgi:hypothetical protein